MDAQKSSVDRIYKLLIIGESSVGKTSIILRYTENKFDNSGIATCGVDVKYKYVSYENIKIRLDIWDTAGQERFRGLAKNYFRGSNGFILVYDITNQKSFEKLKGWMNDAKEKMDPNSKMIVIGNKKDCQENREVDLDILEDFANKNKVKTLEVSAKTNEGIDEIFNIMVEDLVKGNNMGVIKDEDSETDKTFNSLNNSKEFKKKNTCKC
jgi:small GTP-binding protein